MRFQAYDSNRKYDGVNTGHIPTGWHVRFSDNSIGRVVHGNAERSLVTYRPARESGATEAHDWFSNATLEVQA